MKRLATELYQESIRNCLYIAQCRTKIYEELYELYFENDIVSVSFYFDLTECHTWGDAWEDYKNLIKYCSHVIEFYQGFSCEIRFNEMLDAAGKVIISKPLSRRIRRLRIYESNAAIDSGMDIQYWNDKVAGYFHLPQLICDAIRDNISEAHFENVSEADFQGLYVDASIMNNKLELTFREMDEKHEAKITIFVPVLRDLLNSSDSTFMSR